MTESDPIIAALDDHGMPQIDRIMRISTFLRVSLSRSNPVQRLFFVSTQVSDAHQI
jgi:hypothetical protein